jgi:hypothetical protein
MTLIIAVVCEAYNVGCQNTASQIHGDDNYVKLESEQEFEEESILGATVEEAQ